MRELNKLSPSEVKKIKTPGRYGDGGGLWLQVSQVEDRITKSWLFRFMIDGRARQMGLGSVEDYPLAEARDRARDARKLVNDGIDPIDQRRDEKSARILESAKALTFKECAEEWLKLQSKKWSNQKYAAQVPSALQTYAYPKLGNVLVRDIDAGLIESALRPIWEDKHDTAKKLRGYLEYILHWATASNLREGDNPARWKGNLEFLMPAHDKVRDHWPALPYDRIGEFMTDLRQRDGVSALALQLTILTGVRTNETLGAQWKEFDFEKNTWTVPKERTKGKKGKKFEHIIPLSKESIALLRKLGETREGKYVFPSSHAGKPLSNMAMLAVVRRMNQERAKAGLPTYVDPRENNREVVPHGFRSTFTDWTGDHSNFDLETREFATGHAISDKTIEAYRRTTAVEKRRKLMQAWGRYCGQPAKSRGDNVTAIRAQG